jgi:hypothetical protein
LGVAAADIGGSEHNLHSNTASLTKCTIQLGHYQEEALAVYVRD